ncbi:hypothetical protein Pmani_017433 [Petrolisthes manimaculis]|uniref:Uncharacterized protein n=1 Tax=Petrolisthes manimaculis TaxID=1843537 RepID=A0AAE1PPI8_9EUCA|nr:hypothetical protein Pmani_017433 [Petrolisthes manimaculis]
MTGGRVSSKKYVGSKVNIVRWRPAASHYTHADTFISGTWGDGENEVCVWRVPECDDDPNLQHNLKHQGNVNDIQYVSRDTFATASSTGSVHLYQHNVGGHLEHKTSWKQIHSFRTSRSPCTGVTSNGDQIASVGEDGKLIIINPTQERPLRIMESVGGCSVYAAVYVRANEILTGSLQGYLRLWDIRAAQPAKTILHSIDQVGVYDLAVHPTQQHLVAAGGDDGALAIWDLRHTTQPFTIIAAHNGPMSEVRFHPGAPDHLFTGGLDGQLLHWDASTSATPTHTHITPYTPSRQHQGGSVTVWVSSAVGSGCVDTTAIIPPSPLPINSLDIDGTTLIAASDNEAIYTVRQVMLF